MQYRARVLGGSNMDKVIFAVDDCDMSLTVVEYALGVKYTVYTIDSINQMFKLLERIIPDLILLDLYMPEMTCKDVMERLKSHETHAGIPVIIMSGTHTPETITECIDMGAVHFIPKPVLDPVVFSDQVKKYL